MTKESETNLSRPSLDDFTLDRHLASLPSFVPSVGFEDRVMSQVYAPPPRWVVDLKRIVRSQVETRRFRRFALGLMTTSTVSLVLATAFAVVNFSTVSGAVDWVGTAIGLPLWRSLQGVVSGPALDASTFLRPLFVSPVGALITGIATVGLLVFSAGMLACLMSPRCLVRSE